MSENIEERLKRLEIEFGIEKNKEPATYEEFLEQYPDYEELIKYFSPEDAKILEKYSDGIKYPVASGKLLERAERCREYYHKLHPKGIADKSIFERYIRKNSD